MVEGPPQLQGSVAWQEPEAGSVGAEPGAAAKRGAEPDPPAYGSTGLWPDMVGGDLAAPRASSPLIRCYFLKVTLQEGADGKLPSEKIQIVAGPPSGSGNGAGVLGLRHRRPTWRPPLGPGCELADPAEWPATLWPHLQRGGYLPCSPG